jgi:hypothetical protein
MVPVAQGTEVYNADWPPVLARGYQYAQADLEGAVNVLPSAGGTDSDKLPKLAFVDDDSEG